MKAISIIQYWGDALQCHVCLLVCRGSKSMLMESHLLEFSGDFDEMADKNYEVAFFEESNINVPV
jgi:hypothetical protein